MSPSRCWRQWTLSVVAMIPVPSRPEEKFGCFCTWSRVGKERGGGTMAWALGWTLAWAL
eukprot:gene6482-biopygen7382